MNRRLFLTSVLTALLVRAARRRIAPRQVVRAVQTRFYPGSVAPVNMTDVKKTGTWTG